MPLPLLPPSFIRVSPTTSVSFLRSFRHGQERLLPPPSPTSGSMQTKNINLSLPPGWSIAAACLVWMMAPWGLSCAETKWFLCFSDPWLVSESVSQVSSPCFSHWYAWLEYIWVNKKHAFHNSDSSSQHQLVRNLLNPAKDSCQSAFILRTVSNFWNL